MSFGRRLQGLVRIALAGLMVLGFAVQQGQAQTTSASVSGTVQDAQGGVLPGVAVTLTSRTQGNALTVVTDADGRFVFAIVRPDTYSLQVALEGFKTLEQTNLVRQRQRPRLARQPGPRSRADVRGGHGLEPRERAADDERRAIVRAREPGADEHRQQRARSSSTSRRWCPARCRRAPAGTEIGAGQRLHRQRHAAELQQHDDRRRRQHRHRRQRRQHGHDQHRRRRRVQGADQLVRRPSTAARRARRSRSSPRAARRPSTVRATGTAAARTGTPTRWINKRVTPEIPKAKTSRNDGGYTIGGPVFFPGFNENKKKLFFFFSQEHQRRTDPAAERQARVPTALERRGDFSQSVDTSGNPFPYIRDYTTGLPCTASDTRGCFADGGVLGRIPAEPAVPAGPRGPGHLSRREPDRRGQRPQLHEPGSRTARRVAKTCSAWTTRPPTTGA